MIKIILYYFPAVGLGPPGSSVQYSWFVDPGGRVSSGHSYVLFLFFVCLVCRRLLPCALGRLLFGSLQTNQLTTVPQCEQQIMPGTLNRTLFPPRHFGTKNIIFQRAHFLDFWASGLSAMCRPRNLESNAFIGIEISTIDFASRFPPRHFGTKKI